MNTSSAHEKIVYAVQKLNYGMDADEFEARMAVLFPGGSPTAMSSWISHAEDVETEIGHLKAKSLLEYYVEFGLVKQHYGDEISLRLFNLAEESCPNVFELRGAAKLLKDGVEISKVHDLVLENDICMTASEDMEFGKAIIAFVEQKATEPVPEMTKSGAVHNSREMARGADAAIAETAAVEAVNGYLSVFAERSVDREYALETGIAAGIAEKTAVSAETINGAVTYGDWVIVRPDEAYGCLVGQVTAVDKADSEAHDTDNPGDDIHVNFAALEYSDSAKADLLEALSGYFPDAGNFDALPPGDVIMAPESLISLTGLDFDGIDKLSASYKAAREFGNRVLAETFDGLEQQLIARVEQNYTDYNRMLLSFGQRELIDMAGKIAAMQDAYEYMTTSRGYSDNELRFYIQYACPLEIVADALIAYDADEGDIGFAMDFAIEHQESISPEYTKIVDEQPAAESVKQTAKPKFPRAADTEPKSYSLTSQLDAATAEANERNAARTPQTQQKSKNKEID